MANTAKNMVEKRIEFGEARLKKINATKKSSMPQATNGTTANSVVKAREQFNEERSLWSKIMGIVFDDSTHKRVTKLTQKNRSMIETLRANLLASEAKENSDIAGV